MYWIRTIEVVSPEGQSKENTYLLCDSFEEFIADTAGVVGVHFVWAAQIGRQTRAEAREKAKKEVAALDFKRNSRFSPNVRAVMNELGAVVSAAVVAELYGTRNEEGMREARELIINRKVGKKFHSAKAYIPGYESIFDGTINKTTQAPAEMNSDYAYAYCDIGSAYYENHDYRMAIENYSQALKIDPDYTIAYYHRGGNYFMNGDFDNAIEDIRQFLKVYPANNTAKELLERAINRHSQGSADN